MRSSGVRRSSLLEHANSGGWEGGCVGVDYQCNNVIDARQLETASKADRRSRSSEKRHLQANFCTPSVLPDRTCWNTEAMH